MEPFDYSRYSSDFSESWQDYVEETEDFPRQVLSLYKQIVDLPSPEIQYPVVLSYLFIPSAIARIVPLLQLYGRTGSGKSLTGYLASRLYGAKIFSSTDTFAAIRNGLQEQKYHIIDEEYRLERNCILVWEDIDLDVLQSKPDLYRLLKFGIDRSTDTISIAGMRGTNYEFHCFCPKIFSSISPIFNHPELEEIHRRTLVIKTRPIIENGKVLLDPKTLDWSGFDDEFMRFWRNESRCCDYVAHRKALLRYRKHSISPERWLISVDLLATALTIGIVDSAQEAIALLEEYWSLYGTIDIQNRQITLELLQELIDEDLNKHYQIFGEEYDFRNHTISAEVIKVAISRWSSQGKLDISPYQQKVLQCMRQLGYKLTTKGYQRYE